MTMKIINITRGAIYIELNGSSVRIGCEMLVPQKKGDPNYVIYSDDIRVESSPEKIVLESSKIEMLIEFLKGEMRQAGIEIAIE